MSSRRQYLEEQQVSDMAIVTTFPKAKEVSHFYVHNLPSLTAVTPAPCSYNLRSEFSPSPSSKAFSFGIAREAYSKVFIKEQPPMDKSIPGPG